MYVYIVYTINVNVYECKLIWNNCCNIIPSPKLKFYSKFIHKFDFPSRSHNVSEPLFDFDYYCYIFKYVESSTADDESFECGELLFVWVWDESFEWVFELSISLSDIGKYAGLKRSNCDCIPFDLKFAIPITTFNQGSS